VCAGLRSDEPCERAIICDKSGILCDKLDSLKRSAESIPYCQATLRSWGPGEVEVPRREKAEVLWQCLGFRFQDLGLGIRDQGLGFRV